MRNVVHDAWLNYKCYIVSVLVLKGNMATECEHGTFKVADTKLQEKKTRRSQLGTGDRRAVTTIMVLSLASTSEQRSQHLASG